MKKRLSFVIALIVAFTLAVSMMVACTTNVTVEAIEFVNPVKEYKVGDTIDYGNLQVKVSYSDENSEVKKVSELVSAGAILTEADLSKAGKTSYSLTYKEKTAKVELTVSEKGDPNPPPATATVQAIEFVNPVTEYKVGDVIGYNNLQVKVSYSNGSSVVKKVSELVSDGAKLTEADLSKAGKTSYSLTYKEKTAKVDLTVSEKTPSTSRDRVVSFNLPAFYSTYLANSKKRAADEVENRGDFRLTEEVYEVGNANRFIFEPTATVLKDGKRTTIDNPKTTARVYVKTSKDGAYSELAGDAVSQDVVINNNTYKFSDSAADKYYKLEISLDKDSYDTTSLGTGNDTIAIEVKILNKGYNVYDQVGLSVMADLEKYAYSKEIWKCDYSVNKDENKTIVTPNDDSVKLPADDQYLCQYVDNIDWVVLHSSIELDPDLLPSLYFWDDDETKENGAGYSDARTSLASVPDASTWQNSLKGTLRDGNNSGITEGEKGDINYSRVMDVNRITTSDGVQVQGNYGIETNIALNMAKGLYATKNVSVSGNYMSVTYTNRDQTQRSEKGRILLSYADYDVGTKVTDPVSHWNVFQMLQPRVDGAKIKEFTIKNIAMQGNNPMLNETASFKPTGLMLSSSYVTQINYINVNANQFFTNIVQDNYGDLGSVDGCFSSDAGNEKYSSEWAKVLIDNTKIYNAYSNMCYMWRGHVTVKNSEMIGSGGPLFIMSDDNHNDKCDNISDDGGPTLDVDTLSKLQAYATGQESWYQTYNATTLFGTITGTLNDGLKGIGKTVTFKNPENAQSENNFVNVIAVNICQPSSIFNGVSYDDGSKLDVRGVFTQTNEEGETVNKFAMHNNVLNQIRPAVGGNGTLFPVMMKSGNAELLSDLREVYNTSVCDIETPGLNGMLNFLLSKDTSGKVPEEIKQQCAAKAKFSSENGLAWMNEKSDLACLYLSAGAITGSENAPYFAIILQIGNLAQA